MLASTEPVQAAGIDVARIVKKLAERAGLERAKYVGHSLRVDTRHQCRDRGLLRLAQQKVLAARRG